jgi:IS30 family transposase
VATVRLSEAEKEQIWDLTREGQSVRMVARRLGRAQATSSQ